MFRDKRTLVLLLKVWKCNMWWKVALNPAIRRWQIQTLENSFKDEHYFCHAIEEAQNCQYWNFKWNLNLLLEATDFQSLMSSLRSWILLALCFYWLHWGHTGVQEAIIKEEGQRTWQEHSEFRTLLSSISAWFWW